MRDLLCVDRCHDRHKLVIHEDLARTYHILLRVLQRIPADVQILMPPKELGLLSGKRCAEGSIDMMVGSKTRPGRAPSSTTIIPFHAGHSALHSLTTCIHGDD